MFRVGVLGPLHVEQDGVAVAVPGAKQRLLLAALLLNRGRVLSREALVDILWDDAPPPAAARTVTTHVIRLRRLLGDAGGLIQTRPAGYQIAADDLSVDLDLFRKRVSGGRAAAVAADWSAAAGQFAEALELVRGTVLQDLPACRFQGEWAAALTEECLQAREQRFDAALHAGLAPAGLLPELRLMVRSHPLRERFHEQLMLALHRSGQTAEALAAFRDAREAMVGELGVEPGPALQQLHQLLLAGPPPSAPDPSAPSSPDPPALELTGSQLPADTRLFTGRSGELARLARFPAGIAVIHGMGGVGKTALATRFAHRVSERFPDGQLFADLHGHSPGRPPAASGDVLEFLLRSLGVAVHTLPRDLDQRAALYRSRLAGTRTIILLDNAADTAQVRPLLPGTGECLVLVTSRSRLTGLDDAITVPLDVLPHEDAIGLIQSVAGADRAPAEDPAVAELAQQCGYLPLALRIVSARLRHQRSLTAADLVEDLREGQLRLGRLQDDDRDVVSVIGASWDRLPAADRRLLQLLCQVPGTDVGWYAAAHLADVDLGTARELLHSLADRSMLIEHRPGRYRVHDLVRSYALYAAGDDVDRAAALTRLASYFQYAARAASDWIVLLTDPAEPAVPHGPVPGFGTQDLAMGWLTTELENIVALVEQQDVEPAARAGCVASIGPYLFHEELVDLGLTLHSAAVELTRAMGSRLDEASALVSLGRLTKMSGDVMASAGLFDAALDLYREEGSRLGAANAISEIGRAKIGAGDLAAGHDLMREALALFTELDDRAGRTYTLWGLGRILPLVSGDQAGGIDLLTEALENYTAHGDRRNAARVLVHLGTVRMEQGKPQAAADLLIRSLTVLRETGDDGGAREAWWTLGQVHLTTGDYPAAAEAAEHMAGLCRKAGDAVQEGQALWLLGRVHLANGDHLRSLAVLRKAHDMLGAAGYPAGEGFTLLAIGKAQLAGDDPAAGASLDEALRRLRSLGEVQGQAEALNALALAAVRDGQLEAAAGHSREALELARQAGSLRDEATALEGLASCAPPGGGLDELRAAVALYERIGGLGAKRAAAALEMAEKPAGDYALPGPRAPGGTRANPVDG